MVRILEVRPLEPFSVWLRFADGREGVVDLGELFSKGGVFEPLRDPAEFAKVRVDSETETIVWPGDVDLDPDGLYATVSGLTIEEVWKLD